MSRATIYIASSWKNQHAVEMLTEALRERGYIVLSWIENNYGENPNSASSERGKKFDFETWVNSPAANQSFEFDTRHAMTCNIFIYVGPSGKDAAAECGMCYGQRYSHAGKRIPMLCLWAKGEDFGLMRKMFDFYAERYTEILDAVDHYVPNPHGCFGGKRPRRMDFDTKEEYDLRLSNYEKFEADRPPLVKV